MIEEDFDLEAIRVVASADEDPNCERQAQARAALMALIAGNTAKPAAAPTQIKRRRRLSAPAWRIGACSGIAAAVAAAIMIAVSQGGPVQPATAVAAVLDRAAKASSLVTPVHLAPGQVWYVEQEWTGLYTQNPKSCGTHCYETRAVRWWVGPHRYSMHQYILDSSATLQDITKAPPNVPLTPPKFSPRWSGVGAGYDQPLHYSVMETVLTNVKSLRWLMWHIPGEHFSRPVPRRYVDSIIMMNIQSVLLEPRVPARMLSGLYHLLATTPGATLHGEVTDSLGRAAVEVVYGVPSGPTHPGTSLKFALLFDPKSYALIDLTQTTTSAKFGNSYSDTSYVDSGLVNSIGALPPNSRPNDPFQP